MKGVNGVQMQVHPKFLELCKDIKNERIILKKEKSGDLSFKRLSLTIFKLIKSKPDLYKMITTAEVDLNEI